MLKETHMGLGSKSSGPSAADIKRDADAAQRKLDNEAADKHEKQLASAKKSALFEADRLKKAKAFLGSSDTEDKLGKKTVLGSK